MKKSVKIISVCVAVVAFVAMSFMAATGVALRLNLQKGDNYTVTVKSNQTIVMSAQGQSITQGVLTEQVGTIKVNDANTVFSKWESILAKVSSMGMELVYDSKNPDKTSPMLKAQMKQYEELLKAEATYKFDEQGKQVGEVNVEEYAGPVQSVIRELPKEEMVKGYTWEKEDSKDVQGMSIKTTVSFTVKEVNKKNVVVDYVCTGGSDEMKINQTGTLTFDKAKGIVVKDTSKTDITASLSEQGMVIPMKINGTSEIVVK